MKRKLVKLMKNLLIIILAIIVFALLIIFAARWRNAVKNQITTPDGIQ